MSAWFEDCPFVLEYGSQLRWRSSRCLNDRDSLNSSGLLLNHVIKAEKVVQGIRDCELKFDSSRPQSVA